MNFDSPKIYGYGVADNSAVDECLAALDADNLALQRTSFDNTSFTNIFSTLALYLGSQYNDYSSISIIGMINIAIKSQFIITDGMLDKYQIAKNNDPLKSNADRLTAIKQLDDQLSAYLSDQRLLVNEYCV